MKSRNSEISVVLVGGSGFWAERSHIPNLLEIRPRLPLRVTAIIDPVPPADRVKKHPRLAELVAADHPQYVDPANKSIESIFGELEDLPDAVIITSNPESHYQYAEFCARNRIDYVVDKPVFARMNSAHDRKNAAGIMLDFDAICKLHQAGRGVHSRGVTLLRRRQLVPFVNAMESLADVHERTGQGISHASLTSNGGIHKFPEEFA